MTTTNAIPEDREMIVEPSSYDDFTMQKVHDGLERAGLDLRQRTDAISEMQNEGILFRERV